MAISRYSPSATRPFRPSVGILMSPTDEAVCAAGYEPPQTRSYGLGANLAAKRATRVGY